MEHHIPGEWTVWISQVKVAIVTGGASGLGRATVEAYVAKGARVAIFDMNEANANEVIAELGGDKVAFWQVNVADEDVVKAAVEGWWKNSVPCTSLQQLRRHRQCLQNLRQEWRLSAGPVHAGHQYQPGGHFNVSRHAAEQMANNDPINSDGGRGVIINTASVAAYEGQAGPIPPARRRGWHDLPMARDLAS